ncbi:uncharacterized protein RJT21DRAFT_20340 [Scheffersomyces amazonensis]|uniref:uncharacterized protein n=1 Tax=Scheffersomyces amazonensis TaxID=1078765 RepID=UPI00315CB4AF
MGNYYDLDDILADGEKVPCRFNMTVPGLGYLEGNPGKQIHKDSKVELPFWLAQILAICVLQEESGQSFVDIAAPEAVSTKVLNAIKTSSTSVDLHKLAPNYYKFIERWCSMYSDPDATNTVMQMLKERAFEINNYASNLTKGINNEFLYSLDEFEKKLYKQTSESNKQMRNWLRD